MTDARNPSDEQKIYHLLVSASLAAFGSDVLYEILTNGDPEYGIEPLEGASADAMDDWMRHGWSDQRAAAEWRAHSDILDRLERLSLAASEDAIRAHVEQHGQDSYHRHLKTEVSRTPDYLRPRLLQRALDHAESGAFDHPRDWERLLGVLQLEARVDRYPGGRDATDNLRERRNVWDSLLKFTKYTVVIDYEADGRNDSIVKDRWAQKQTAAHNTVLHQLPEDAEFVDAELLPVKRYQPGETYDPLSDLDAFVYYE